MDTRLFKVLTFDCYGTLIDWESGIAAALGPILEAHGVTLPRGEILAQHARFEPELQGAGFRPYREVLAGVVDRFGEHYGFRPAAAERDQLPASIRDWPPFDDTVAALHRLGQEFLLVILSNIDDDLFALSAPQLGVDFEAVITAQQVGSYKPAPGHFTAALERFGPREQILHVAQSRFHDIAPARALGLRTVWVNRRHAQQGGGATPASAAVPDLEVPDLATLADRLCGAG